MALRTLYAPGRFVLVSRAGFPSDPAYLVTEALVERFGVDEALTFGTGVPVHSGSADYLADL